MVVGDVTVQQSGGDFTTLDAALTDADRADDDTIDIQGIWSVADTTAATTQEAGLIIQIAVANASYHDGVYNPGDHYRLAVSGGGHCLTINNTGCTIDGLAISQDSTTTSAEGIRLAINSGSTTIKNCIIQATNVTADQDGVFMGNIAGTCIVFNTIIYGFGRAGLDGQMTSGTRTQNWDVNSCDVHKCQTSEDADGGGIVCFRLGGSTTYNMDIFNSIVMECETDSADNFNESGVGGTATWRIDNSITSDTSISGLDASAVGAVESETVAYGSGTTEVIFTSETAPVNLLLIDDATNNVAQNAHSITTTARSGQALPTLDITGQTRDTASNKVDIGADAFPVAAAGGPVLRPPLAYMRTHLTR